jgi:hypothetical protein
MEDEQDILRRKLQALAEQSDRFARPGTILAGRALSR